MKRIISLLISVCMLISIVPTIVFAGPIYFNDGDFKYRTNTAETAAIIVGLQDGVTVKDLVLPSQVTYGGKTYEVYAIDNSAFADNTDIESVYMPDTYTTLLINTFHGCRNLKEVTLSKNLTGTMQGTFQYCSSLTECVIPSGVTTLTNTFRYCTNLEKVEVPASVTSVSAIFDGCNKAMSTINVIAPVGSTAETYFRNLGCTMNDEGNEPEEPEVPDTPVITHPAYFADGDFKYRTNSAGTKAIVTGLNDDVTVTDLVLPESVTYSGTTYEVYAIENDAFANNTDIESVYMPDTYTTLLINTFYGCRNLKEVTLSKNLEGTMQGTFLACSSLEGCEIPSGVTTLTKTFSGCTSLEKVIIPKSVVSIDDYSFSKYAFNPTTEVLSLVTIYCYDGSYAKNYATSKGIGYEIMQDSFSISKRSVEISGDVITVKASFKNNGYFGTVDAICAVYKISEDNGPKELHCISVKECTVPVGDQEEIVFVFNGKYRDNLEYTIFVFNDELTPFTRAVSLPLEDTEESVSNNAQVHVYENFGADSLWDKTGDALSASKYAGLINVGFSDTKTNAPAEAYRSFTPIEDRKITIEYDFSMESHINGAAFRLLDGQDSVFGLVTDQGKLYLEQPSNEKFYLMDFMPSMDKNVSGYYVKAELDLANKKIASLRINGKIVATNKPFATDTNSVDGFDIYTPFEATGNVLNRMLKIYSNYEVNEIFYDGINGKPEDWTYEANGGNAAIYTTNSRMPDRYSMKFDTQNGSVSAIKKFDYLSGNLVFETMVLQPKKRSGVAFSVNEEDASLFEITSDGEYYYFVSGNKKTTLYDYMENVWYGFKVEFDTLNSKADVYVNNKLVLNDVEIDNHFNYINSINISATKDSSCMIFDDVKLYHQKVIPDDYVEAPVVPTVEKPFVIGMQMCNLWTPGQYNKGWDYIKSAPDRMPVLGAYDEGNPEVNDWEIKWLVEHGIDYQAICTYPNLHYSETEAAGPYKPNNVREGDSLYEGYLNAEYSDKMKFSIIYENSIITSGEAYYDEFFNYTVPYWIEYYFKDDRYLKIDNRPVISIYIMDNFLKMFGTMGTEDDKINDGIARFRQMCIDAGVGNPYIISHGTGCYEHNFANYSVYDIDSIGLYGWPKNSPVARQKNIINSEIGWSNTYGLDFVPSVMPRQDLSAWDLETGFKAEKEDLTEILTWLKSDVAGKMSSKKGISKNLMLLQSWNEYGEGHYMMPTVSDGFTYLDAVREVFVGDSSHSDDYPTESQKSRINQMVDQDRNVTVIRENPLPEIPTDSYVKKGWYFTNSADAEDWVALSENTTVSRSFGKLVVTPGVNEPIIGLNDISDCDLYDVTYIKIRMKNNNSSAGGVVFFTTDSEGTFDNNKRVYFASPQSKLSTYTDYYVPVGQNVRWKGKLTGLRIEPGIIWNKGVGNEFRIESIELIADKQLTNGVKIVRNGTTVATQNSPAYRNGQLMVPLQDVAKQSGLQVNWLGGNDSYIVTNSSGGVWFKCGDTSCLKLNGTTTTSAYSVDQVAFAESEDINDAVYVSVKLFKDIFGITVTYDESSKTIKIQ